MPPIRPSSDASLGVARVFVAATGLFLAAACSRPAKPAPPEPRSGELPGTPSAAVRSAPAGPLPADGCTGLEAHRCAQTAGCLLDQPQYQELRCRPAENACERAVRHADLIGKDADPAVTPELVRTAEEMCRTVPGCATTAGKCSCACAILGNCDCTCGGSYLPRCTTQMDKQVYDGRPPNEGGNGALAELGKALVAVKRAPANGGFVVSPLPDVRALVGVDLRTAEHTLGTGRRCDAATVLAPPCAARDQLTWDLFRAAPAQRGGGPTLVLDIDDKRVVRSARIVGVR